MVFTSWSWAGWRGNTGSTIAFGDVQMRAQDMWNIDWHFHRLNDETGNMSSDLFGVSIVIFMLIEDLKSDALSTKLSGEKIWSFGLSSYKN